MPTKQTASKVTTMTIQHDSRIAIQKAPATPSDGEGYDTPTMSLLIALPTRCSQCLNLLLNLLIDQADGLALDNEADRLMLLDIFIDWLAEHDLIQPDELEYEEEN